ncbi:MAG: hypothetical protein LUQ38_09985 [Methanotrichaceae archaeon]|nr:hypothetical protein [Methanotrichaceae archaeon]
MGKNGLPLIMIFLCLFLAGLLSLNILAAPLDSNGSLRLQVIAGMPRVFNDPPLAGGKYPAGDATVSVFRSDLDFFFKDFTDNQGQLTVQNLPVGLDKYRITWRDFRGDMWLGEGSVVIKNGELSAKLVELKRETFSG